MEKHSEIINTGENVLKLVQLIGGAFGMREITKEKLEYFSTIFGVPAFSSSERRVTAFSFSFLISAFSATRRSIALLLSSARWSASVSLRPRPNASKTRLITRPQRADSGILKGLGVES